MSECKYTLSDSKLRRSLKTIMNILITGISSDISQAIARRRIDLGDNVFMTTSRNEIASSSDVHKNKIYNFNLLDPNAFQPQLNKILSEGLQGLILSACTELPRMQTFHKISMEDTEKFFKANVSGNMWLLKKILPHFVENKMGRIIFISSSIIDHYLPGYSLYSSVKSAMESVIKSIAVEYGTENVTANILRLGVIKTRRNERFWSRPGYVERVQSKSSLGKIGIPDQVAIVLDPLLHKDTYVQGATWNVDGGIKQV